MAVTDPHAPLVARLLGELDDGRRREFERHLEVCAACRADVAELEPMIARGRSALPGPGAPPADLTETTLRWIDPAGRAGAVGESARPRRIPALAIAGALGALLIAVLIVLAVGGGDDEEAGSASTAAPPEMAPELRAELTGSAGGATIEIDEAGASRSLVLAADSLPPLGEGEFYELWLVGEGETRSQPARVSAGTFRPNGDGVAELTATVGVAPAGFERIEVTRERDRLPDASDEVVLRLRTKGLIQLG